MKTVRERALAVVSALSAFAVLGLGSCERVEGCEYTGSCAETGGVPAAGTGGDATHGGEAGTSAAWGGAGGAPAAEAGAGGALAQAGQLAIGGSPESAGSGGISACTEACSGATPLCDERGGECVECLEDPDCSAQKPACDPESRRCTECVQDSHCDADTPACDPEPQRCVECTADEHCGGTTPACDTEKQRCVGCLSDAHCESPTPLCDTETRSCVACLEQADCKDPRASRCSQGSCVPCAAKAQCQNIPGKNVCYGGICVECTVADEGACNDKSCNPKTRQCTRTTRGSVGLCRPCAADSECIGGDLEVQETRCVSMEFEGEPQPGGYCLRRATSSCPRPFSQAAVAAASLSGADPELYCGLESELTRCEAVLDLVDARACADGEDTSCGCPRDADGNCTAAGRGGVCGTVDGVAKRCTYPCGTVSDCPTGKSCSIDVPYCE